MCIRDRDAGFDPDNIMVYGTMMPTDWTKYIALLHTNDAGILNEDGSALSISSDAGIEVIQSIADLGNVIHCAPSSAMAKGAFSDASAMLMNGQVAMVIDGGWALANYTNEGFDVGVAPIPAFKHPADISWTAGLDVYKRQVMHRLSFFISDSPSCVFMFLLYIQPGEEKRCTKI